MENPLTTQLTYRLVSRGLSLIWRTCT